MTLYQILGFFFVFIMSIDFTKSDHSGFLVAFIGQPVTFDCGSDSKVKWMKDGRELTYTDNLYVLKSVKKEHAGEYVCLGENSDGTFFKSEIKLIVGGVQEPSRINPRTKTVTEGENVEFKCYSENDTQWYFNQNVLPKNALVSELEGESILSIVEVTSGNVGYYYCSGHRYDGVQFMSASLLKVKAREVRYGEIIPKTVGVLIDEIIELKCVSDGKVEWQLDGEKLREMKDKDTSRVIFRDNTLYVRAKLKDAGEYKCVGRYPNMTQFEAEAIVLVGNQGNKASPSYQEVQVGQDVTMECNAKGYTPIWMFNNGPRPISTPSKQLHIKNIQKKHAGIYKCYYVKSYRGNMPMLSSAEVKVLDNSKISPSYMEAEKSSNVKITCFGPKLDKWTFNYGELPDNAYVVGNSLHIKKFNIMNEGKYTCEGDSDEKFDWSQDYAPFVAEATIRIKGRPAGIVYPFKVSVCQGDTVTFFCDTPKPKRWKFNYNELPDNAKVSGKWDNLLTISNIQTSNEGIYLCSYQRSRLLKTSSTGLLYIEATKRCQKQVASTDFYRNLFSIGISNAELKRVSKSTTQHSFFGSIQSALFALTIMKQ